MKPRMLKIAVLGLLLVQSVRAESIGSEELAKRLKFYAPIRSLNVPFAQCGMARPLLFQNSLHNSTAGFVTMMHKISGPMLTVSNLAFSGEDALDTASLLLADGLCNFCLSIGVDVRLPDLGPELELNSVNASWRREGAAAVLLGTRQASDRLGLQPLGRLTRVKNNYATGESRAADRPYYDSDAVELLVNAVRSADEPAPLHCLKADGSSSRIEWRR